MKRLFAVIKPDAEFMTGLHREGFVALAGPLEGTNDVLLIVRAESAVEITARLRIMRIDAWDVRLGALPA